MVSFQINLEILNTTTLQDLSIIDTSLNNKEYSLISDNEVEKTLENATTSYKLEIGNLEEKESKIFELRLWMDENTPTKEEYMNKTFESKITVTVSQNLNVYTESILNGADPVLKDELVPVTIESDGTVRKADLAKKWYSYENQEWANAIILQNSYDALSKKGSVAGATKEDGYVNFDGVNDYINLGYSGYNFSNQLSVVLHFRYLNSSNSGTMIDNLENGGFNIGIYNGQIRAQVYVNGGYRFTDFHILEQDTFYTVVMTYDGNFLKLYINGELIDELNYSGVIKKVSYPILIGRNPNDNEYAKIDVKQAAVYNRVLSEEEIKETCIDDIKVTNTDKLLSYVDFTDHEFGSNEIIPEDSIGSYFVWIPKYRYQLWDLGEYNGLTSLEESKVHTIPVIFGNYNTSDEKNGECTTPMLSGESGNCEVGDYMTHPAFLSIPSNGFWVGKFETSKGNTSGDNTNNPNGVQVKPNVSSWRNINNSNAFYTSYAYKRNLDSHMMKNTEWGAVAYLQHSAYGSHTSVRNNNNSNYITGYSSVNEPTCGFTNDNRDCNKYGTSPDITQPYNTIVGYLASTTGNISGIYDMSGGTWENVMGVMEDQNGNLIARSSGFTSWPEEKYYDKYLYGTNYTTYTNRILGDATGEMGSFQVTTYGSQTNRQIGPWYSNQAFFISNDAPWFSRSTRYAQGIESGLFAFCYEYGYGYSTLTFRVVLTPTN